MNNNTSIQPTGAKMATKVRRCHDLASVSGHWASSEGVGIDSLGLCQCNRL